MPCCNLRSAASSLSSSPSVSEPPKKKFACTHDGCSKSFSRSEHLHRHSLNHKDGTNTCARCSAHFRRRDLLDRHMLRHKEKDDEAGGEGLGHLATRKRLWRDADGNIITGKRPFQPAGVREEQLSTSPEPSAVVGGGRQRISAGAPSMKARCGGRARVRHVNRKEPPPEQKTLDEAIQIAGPDQLDFLSAEAWTTQSEIQRSLEQGMRSDNVKQETDVSYDSSIATLDYYTWLEKFHGYPTSFTRGFGQIQPRLVNTTQNYAPSYASSSEYSSDCLSPASLNPNLLSRRESFDEFLPLSILATNAASMRRHTYTDIHANPMPTAQEIRRDGHVVNPSRYSRPYFDYDGSSLFSETQMPELCPSRSSTSSTSSRLSSPNRTPGGSLPETAFGLFSRSGFEKVRQAAGDASLAELNGFRP